MAIASGIVSYILYNFSKIFKESKMVYFLYIPFLLLPVLDHNLYPLRLTLYSYIEAFLICQLIFIKKLGKNNKANLLVLSVLLILLCSWRTEGMVYLILVPILFLILLKKELPDIKIRVMYTILTIAISFMLIIPQETIYKEKYSRSI